VDFSRIEQAAETYRPNQDPAQSAVRSQQTSDVRDGSGANATGVPGALTNQPPAPATAPLTTPAVPDGAAGAAGQGGNNRKDATINYEVDKTVRYVQQPMGGVKRLSVGVVVNHKKETGKDGKITVRPLTAAELTQITNLVREAMGYSQERGDTLKVENTPFAGMEKEVIPEVPLWKQPEMIDLAIALARYLAGFLVIAWLFFKFIKPLLNTLSNTISPPPPQSHNKKEEDGAETEDNEDAAIVHIGKEREPMGNKPRTYQDNLEAAKDLARTDPKMVANIVKQWVGTNE
jgi:flagellar M-ring protein FliF